MIGTTLGHYEITEKIGAGGMGEVWRARDTKLDRDVAIKVLPQAVVQDPDRLRRFEQEARAAGGLNHPNLVTVFDLGTHDGLPYMVMELVDGETLRDKLRVSGTWRAGSSRSGSGSTRSAAGEPSDHSDDSSPSAAVAPRRTFDYCIQIATGLAAAHDAGITHRDLKPENVIVTRDGRVKILDFGLAKLTERSSAAQTEARTIAAAETEPGTVLGTAGYMSPEQVRGEPVDHRSDIFSLGVIAHEMLSGRHPFRADTSIGTMNAILTQETPVLASSDSGLSPAVDRIVGRCLEKEPELRFQSSHDLAYAMEAVRDASGSTAAADSVAPRRTRTLPLALAAMGMVTLAVGFLAGRSQRPPTGGTPGAAPALSNYHILPLTFDAGRETQPSLSPNGRSLVYVSDRDGDEDIYFQRVGGEKALNLTADSPEDDYHPAFSPDGERIAFVSERQGDGIFVMGATGESVRRLTDFGGNPSWAANGEEVIFSSTRIYSPVGRGDKADLWRVDVATGQTRKLEVHDGVEPTWSPNGKWITFWGLPMGKGQRTLYTIPAAGGDPVPFTDDHFFNWCPEWSADGRWLLFASNRGGTMDLWRFPMDPATGLPTGEARPLTASTEWCAQPSSSRDGTRIACVASRSMWSLVRQAVPRASGEPSSSDKEVLLRTARRLSRPAASPDGAKLVFHGADPWEDLFLSRVDGSGLRRLTNDPHKDRGPTWAPGSHTIYFFSNRSGRYEIWKIRADGSGLTQVTELEGGNVHDPRVSPDGKTLLAFSADRGQGCLFDLAEELPLREPNWFDGPDGSVFFAAGGWSPDGTRLLGFKSSEGDEPEAYVYRLADGSYARVPGRMHHHAWHDDGLVMSLQKGEFEVVDVETGESIGKTSTSLRMFQMNWTYEAGHDWIYGFEQDTESDIWMLEAPEPPR